MSWRVNLAYDLFQPRDVEYGRSRASAKTEWSQRELCDMDEPKREPAGPRTKARFEPKGV